MVSGNIPPKGGRVDTAAEVKSSAAEVLKTFKEALKEQNNLGSDLENLRAISNIAYHYANEVEQRFLEIARKNDSAYSDSATKADEGERSIEYIVTKVGAAVVQIWCSDLHIGIEAENN